MRLDNFSINYEIYFFFVYTIYGDTQFMEKNIYVC